MYSQNLQAPEFHCHQSCLSELGRILKMRLLSETRHRINLSKSIVLFRLASCSFTATRHLQCSTLKWRSFFSRRTDTILLQLYIIKFGARLCVLLIKGYEFKSNFTYYYFDLILSLLNCNVSESVFSSYFYF